MDETLRHLAKRQPETVHALLRVLKDAHIKLVARSLAEDILVFCNDILFGEMELDARELKRLVQQHEIEVIEKKAKEAIGQEKIEGLTVVNPVEKIEGSQKKCLFMKPSDLLLVMISASRSVELRRGLVTWFTLSRPILDEEMITLLEEVLAGWKPPVKEIDEKKEKNVKVTGADEVIMMKKDRMIAPVKRLGGRDPIGRKREMQSKGFKPMMTQVKDSGTLWKKLLMVMKEAGLIKWHLHYESPTSIKGTKSFRFDEIETPLLMEKMGVTSPDEEQWVKEMFSKTEEEEQKQQMEDCCVIS